MIGAAIGAGVGLLGSLIGGFGSAAAARKARREQDRREREESQRYQRERYAAPGQRADVLYLLDKTREAMREENRRARGQQAVMGGTESAVAGSRTASAAAMAETAGRAAMATAAQHERQETRHEAAQDAISQARQALDYNQSVQTAKAGEAALKAAGQIASAYYDHASTPTTADATQATQATATPMPATTELLPGQEDIEAEQQENLAPYRHIYEDAWYKPQAM